MTARILKFGRISEMENGDLLFENFYIDANHQYNSEKEAILHLVISRLIAEIEELEEKNE